MAAEGRGTRDRGEATGSTEGHQEKRGFRGEQPPDTLGNASKALQKLRPRLKQTNPTEGQIQPLPRMLSKRLQFLHRGLRKDRIQPRPSQVTSTFPARFQQPNFLWISITLWKLEMPFSPFSMPGFAFPHRLRCRDAAEGWLEFHQSGMGECLEKLWVLFCTV